MSETTTEGSAPSPSGELLQAKAKTREAPPRAPAPGGVAPGRALPPRPVMLQALEASGQPADIPPDSQNPWPGDAGRGQASELLDAQAIADAGTRGAGGALPHGDRIQAAFGRHDLSGVQAFVGGEAQTAAAALGARAFATGDRIGFGQTPDLHTAAHEAAHVVQQQRGVHLASGVGATGDAFEQHADAVADAVVRGGPAEALLDGFVGGGGGAGPVVQRETQSQIEARQPWERYRLTGPVAAEDTAVTAAQQANIALGFPPATIDRILQRLDFTRSHRRGTFTREATEAIAAFQGRLGLSGGSIGGEAAPAPEGSATGAAAPGARAPGATTPGAGDAAAAAGAPAAGTGVLDEATVMALDVGAAVRGLHNRALRHYRTSPAWRSVPAEELTTRRDALIRSLGIAEGDLTLETTGRGRRARTRVAVTDAFAHRAYGWQLWRSRGQDADGLLDEEDLRALGAVPEPEAAATPEAAAPEGDAAAAEAQTAREDDAAAAETEATAAEGPDDPADETIPDPPQSEVTPLPGGELRPSIEGMVRLSQEYLRDVQRLRRVTPEATRVERRAALAGPMEERFAMFRRNLDLWAIEGLDTNLLERPRGMVTRNWARRWVRVLTAFLEGRSPEAAAAPATGAGGRPVPRGTLPVGRPMGAVQGEDVGVETIEAARAFLQERGVIVRDERIVADGWDPRLNRADGAEEPVNDIARNAVAGLTSLKSRLTQGRSDLDAALAVEDPERAHLRRVYFEVAHRDYSPPPVVRTPFDVHLPDVPSAERIAAWRPAQLVQHVNQLRNAMRNEIRRLDAEIRRNTPYQHAVHMENPHGMVVDLHRSGVDVCWGEGTPMEVDLFHLDPVFAVAMFRYLEVLRGLGVTKLWTSGFLRPHGTAISILDAHPRGMACDITGFQFGDTLIHLRGGFPMEPGNSNYDHWQRGHSDWYDERNQLNGRSHRAIMLGMAEILPRYFGRIIGPGHNAAHMNHFHVETYGNPRTGPSLRAISEYDDMPDWTHARSDRLDPSWRTGGTPPPALADPE